MGVVSSRITDVDMPGSRTSALERQLLEAEAKYRALVENIPAVLYINLCDVGDTTVYVSPQTELILGITPEDWYVNDGNWIRFVHPDDQERVLEKYESFIRAHQEGVDEYRFVRPDGRVIWLHDRLSVVRDPDGRPLFIQGVIFDITEQKAAEELAGRQVELLQKVENISRDFTDLVLEEAGLKRILERLARIVENPVVLEDTAHQLLEFAVHVSPIDQVLDEWERHSRVGHDYDNPRTPRVEQIGVGCAWTPIWIRRELWGRLHIIATDSQIDEVDVLALDRAAASVGLSLLSERDSVNLVEMARGAIIFDILQGRCGPQEMLSRARALGIDLDGRRLAAAVVRPIGLEESDSARGLSARERHRLRAAVLKEVRSTISDAGVPALSTLDGDTVLIIVGIPHTQRVRARVEEVGRQIIQRIADRVRNLTSVVGVSEEARSESLRSALEDAGEAASFAARTDTEAVKHFDDLGVSHLLLELASTPELARFVEAELKPLLEAEVNGTAIYIPTLRAYLDSSGRKVTAAERLHIDRRTLYYRLDRIERILERSLEDQEVRLRLDLALRSLDLLRNVSAKSRASGELLRSL
jgi:PucR family transcriptional regulator, purine catabolism regulatory protein